MADSSDDEPTRQRFWSRWVQRGTANPEELPGQIVGKRYRIKGELGRGGMGGVYEAEHLGLGVTVAIKVIVAKRRWKPENVRRLIREARVGGLLSHPHACVAHDAGVLPDGTPYFVMERLYGETLLQRIKRAGAASQREVVEWASQLLSVLVAAHEYRIVHRDIKPANVFLVRRYGLPPTVKLLDFGLAKLLMPKPGASETSVTKIGARVGTIEYMAPEQHAGRRSIDGRADQWGLGVSMYEALSAKRPFNVRDVAALIAAAANGQIRPLEAVADVDPRLAKFVHRLLTPQRDKRFATPLLAMAELLDIRSQLEKTARTGASPSLPRIAAFDTIDDSVTSHSSVYDDFAPTPTPASGIPRVFQTGDDDPTS